MGTLRNGGYTSSGYVEEEQAALDRQLRMLRERKERREKEREEFEELAFGEWLLTKTKEDILKIEKPMEIDGYMGLFHKPKVMEYFIKNEIEAFQKEIGAALSRSREEGVQ